MVTSLFRDIAFHPVVPAPPVVPHDMQLQDPAATFALLRDVLLGP